MILGVGGVLFGVGGAVAQEQIRAEREEHIKNLRNKKSRLEFERGQIKTSNTLLDGWIGNSSSPSELEHNRRKYDRLSKEIDKLDGDLKKFEDDD
ncbi:MAG: hypothetical protein IJT73_05830 [Selenomonadaceae bacterium]|nr:hypothetical protein [Selenomonadaceae bacterium]